MSELNQPPVPSDRRPTDPGQRDLEAAPKAIPTNLRLLQVLEVVTRLGVPVTPSEVNQQLGLPKPTIHRLFATLEEERLLQRDLDGRSYAPGPRLRTLALNTLSSVRVRNARLAVLQALSEEVGETCNITIPDRSEMLYLDRVETQWPLRIQLPTGTRVPLYCTASGKLYLSTLGGQQVDRYLRSLMLERRAAGTLTDPLAIKQEVAQIRRQGYSLDREEFIDGMIAVAVGVFDRQKRLAATLAFHAPVQRLNLEQAVTHLDAMHRAAEELTQIMDEGASDA